MRQPSSLPPLPKVRAGPGMEPDDSRIRFQEAAGIGLDFAYDNGADPQSRGARMFEQTGGGVAVLDLDHDAWPDLYFTQGGQFTDPATDPPPLRHGKETDRLFRNLSGEEVQDVSTPARLVDTGFGQGVAAGDFNNDGFADLYVANIGRNQLHLNNGDGTFTDSSLTAGLSAADWTTSCLIADLNTDGTPDLFDVNYVTGDEVFTLICNGRACSPKVFEGVPDRVLLGQEDGTVKQLENATPTENSKGLGVVAASLRTRGRLDLFIANDQVANFLLRNEPEAKNGMLRLTNDAFLTGLAYNDDGLAMACMGIAADDVNTDGRLDFFVTNFKEEFNTLYLQDESGLFVDSTSRAGLAAAGFPYVGWGTQFLDADLDGRSDLVVVNGHVDDYRDEGGEYQMPSLFYRQLRDGQFQLLSPQQAGDWFEQKRLGRGLARLDWNRDGCPEFVVSSIDDQASLVENVSESCGHFLGIRLTAVASSRDAIGAEVTVVTAIGRRTKQLTAGDGFQASNERIVQFGLGPLSEAVTVQIAWPSGITQWVRDVPVDSLLDVCEGRPDGTLWKGTPPRPEAFSWKASSPTRIPDF